MGLDRLSDAAASICKRQLVEYTVEMAETFDFDEKCIKEVEVRHCWDPAKGEYNSVRARLPVNPSGRPILLAEKWIVRSSPPVRPEQYGSFPGIQKGSATELKKAILAQARRGPESLLRGDG